MKLLSLGMMAVVLFIAVTNWPPWMIEDVSPRMQVMSTLFMAALFLVAVEDIVGINKSSVMLIVAGILWTFLSVGYHPTESKEGAHELHHELNRGLQEAGSVVVFLLPAMGVVESIDHFDGFAPVTKLIRSSIGSHKGRLPLMMCILTFFMSSVIDNLTATIVALKILRHLAAHNEDVRRGCGGLVVIAANAGGCWSPIGDVTTTMLWIQQKISVERIIRFLLLPSMVAGFLPVVGIWRMLLADSTSPRNLGGRLPHGLSGISKDSSPGPGSADVDYEQVPLRPRLPPSFDHEEEEEITLVKVLALVIGCFSILMVPALKMTTGLPPYLGMLLALGLMWLVTDMLQVNRGLPRDPIDGTPSPKAEGPPTSGVVAALFKVDLSGLLFFTGVLLAVGALNSGGVLRGYAERMIEVCGVSPLPLAVMLGVSSAVVDNVPLVQAAIDMFKEAPMDDPLWHLLAIAAGTGGSILSIGSVAGVTLMSMEGISFMWYFKNITLWAVLGFGAGILTYEVELALFT